MGPPDIIESLPTRGEWVEILISYDISTLLSSLSPHGESGLKFYRLPITIGYYQSLPTRGEWVEMHVSDVIDRQSQVSPHTGRVG